MRKIYPWKQAVTTGLIIGIGSFVCFVVADKLNKHFAWGINATTIRGLTGLLTLLILAVGIYTGIQSVKRENGGLLSYKQAFITGLFISVISGILVSLTGLIYGQLIDPGYAAYMIEESKAAMVANGKSAAEIKVGVINLQKQWTTGAQVLQALLGQTLAGTIITAIMGIFIKSKK